MKKIMYTRSDDGGVSIVHPVAKEMLERDLQRVITDEEYETHIWERSVPIDAINPRFIEDSAIPSSREFRNAWRDITPEPVVDIDCSLAKELVLNKIREWRDDQLKKTDEEFIIALTKGEDTTPILAKKEYLRSITENLKAYDTSGLVNCQQTLSYLSGAYEAIKSLDIGMLALPRGDE